MSRPIVNPKTIIEHSEAEIAHIKQKIEFTKKGKMNLDLNRAERTIKYLQDKIKEAHNKIIRGEK